MVLLSLLQVLVFSKVEFMYDAADISIIVPASAENIPARGGIHKDAYHTTPKFAAALTGAVRR